MRPWSFVHAADLHIDSPFRGVTADSASSAVADALHSSTLRAFDALVETTLEREADFLLIAGDVYDGQDRSLRAQLRFRDGLSRLDSAGIESFTVHGNHDPLDSHVTALDWPERAHFFGRKLRNLPALGRDGQAVAMVSGISFPRKEESRNLASMFTKQKTDLFQIGLLHCNIGGDTGHANYAPCTLDDLRAAGMDYWALGHVHTRSVLSEAPWVIYPGNIQGRSIREQGARGCYHVRVDEHGQVTTEFVPLDVVRWSALQVSIDGIETMDALERAVTETVKKATSVADGRAVVGRISIAGRGSLHGELRRDGAAGQLLERVRERFSGEDPFVWVQRISIDSRPVVDLAERMGRKDLLAEVLTTGKQSREAPDGLASLYRGALAQLWGSSRMSGNHLDRPTDEQIEAILTEAELLCLDLLEEEA